MIELTRLNGSPMVVNSDLIKIAEAAPDTMLTLVNGEKIVVLESCGQVMERIVAYRARLLAEVSKLAPFPAGGAPAQAAAIAAALLAQGAERAGRQSADSPEDDDKTHLRRRQEF